MAFEVYYRKWRPQRFSEIVGQEHVSTTLLHAVTQGRVAHSYLFCGPRGTGKTSTARVLSKAVNCLEAEEGDPCNSCGRCQAVNEGRYMDLIELDAASNRGIDEIRNIRERVNLAPMEGGYKVYIIDEAHMLTEHASNAFLKTLEEPPPHAIFILCTTEPHKILPTIVSRCQRFDFRRLTSEAIVARLRSIAVEEGVSVEAEALTAVAHSTGGSLRDAENLLEQLVVSYDGQIGGEQVYELLGLGHGERSLELTRYLLLGNTPSALGTINQAAWDGVDLRQLHRQTLELLRGVLMLQCGSRDSLNLPQETVSQLADLAPKASTSRVMRSLKHLAEINTRFDAASSLPLELAVVEVCLEDVPEDAEPAASSRRQARPQPVPERASTWTPPILQNQEAPTPANPPLTPRKAPGDTSRVPATQPPTSSPTHQEVSESAGPIVPAERGPFTEETADPVGASQGGDRGSEGDIQDQWMAVVKALSRIKGKRFNIGALLRDCKSQHLEGETLILTFAHRSHLERMQEELDDPQAMKSVSEALQKSLGTSYQLRLTLADDGAGNGVPSATQSPLVRAAMSMGARIAEEREQ